jgi:hypothetical protein
MQPRTFSNADVADMQGNPGDNEMRNKVGAFFRNKQRRLAANDGGQYE